MDRMTLASTTLPPSYQQKFDDRYEGLPAASFDNSLEYYNFTLALRQAGISFLTKIIKQKRKKGISRKFMVMAVSVDSTQWP